MGELLNKVFKSLSDLEGLYINGDLKTKKQIVGSIFPEKLVFNGINYRTAWVNEAAELIHNVGKGFIKKKMDKPIKISICPLR